MGTRSLINAAGLVIVSVVLMSGAATLRAEHARDAIRIEVDRGTATRFVVSGFAPRVVHALSVRRPTSSEWERAFAVYVTATDTPRVAVAGSYNAAGDQLVFTPSYALVPGLEYEAVVAPDRLLALAGSGSDSSTRAIRRRVVIPAVAPMTETVVASVYPSSDSLPENVLRFYIVFSRPMRQGDASRHLTLVDENGEVVPQAFLGFEPELWDAARRRLTVLLDPGRIKRGLRPNAELGTPVVAGHRYSLRVARAWRDANGASLVRDYEKSFVVIPPERRPLDVGAWTVAAPRAGTRDPIIIRTNRQLDRALVRRLIRVVDSKNAMRAVEIETADADRTLRLTPLSPWSAGTYDIAISGELEDVAGNTVQRAFDSDLSTPRSRPRDDIDVVRVRVSIAS